MTARTIIKGQIAGLEKGSTDLGNNAPSEGIDEINGYFDQRWQKLDDQEFEYRFRVNERYSMLFLSHTVIYQRL